MANVKDVPNALSLLDTITDPVMKQTALETANVAMAQAQNYAAEQAKIISKLAATRTKMDDGTATQAEKEQYYKDKAELQRLDTLINNSGKLVASDVKKIKQEQLQKKLDTLKGSQGHLTFASAEKMFEYVLRTQALNPYSRERACDIDLLESIVAIAEQTGEEQKQIQALISLIKQVF
jgi:hypothetical protein